MNEISLLRVINTPARGPQYATTKLLLRSRTTSVAGVRFGQVMQQRRADRGPPTGGRSAGLEQLRGTLARRAAHAPKANHSIAHGTLMQR